MFPKTQNKLLTGQFQCAGNGNIEEFERLIEDDINKLTVANPSGICAVHSAAGRNRVAILACIARHNGGRDYFKNIKIYFKYN